MNQPPQAAEERHLGLERAVHGVTSPRNDVRRLGRLRDPGAATAAPDPDRSGFVLVAGLGTIQELVAFYRDWMAVDGWIFDAEFGADDPCVMEERNSADTSFSCSS